jgi:hypothetical protein
MAGDGRRRGRGVLAGPVGLVVVFFSGEQDQAGQDQGTTDSLARDEGLAEHDDGRHRPGKWLQGEQQACT